MTYSFKSISVIGLGYIGLPTAAVIAARGVQVIGVDVNQHAVDTINRGEIHIVEPELDVVVKSVVASGKLKATLKPEKADAFLVAVPTPFKEGHKPDLSYIESASKSIAPVLERGNLVVLESTSPVGATEQMAKWLAEARPDLTFPHQVGDEADIRVAHCPERVLPGHVLRELVENDRIIGGMTKSCTERATQLYKIFVQGECVPTDARTAEMSKLTENSFRDVNIAFANELSLICERLNISVWELIKLANRHPRVNILQPGPGVGGHCIAVDPWFIVDSAPDLAKLIGVAREVNDGKPVYVIDKVKQAAAKFKQPVVACLGLAFKPDIDDLRESPSLEIVKHLAEDGVGSLLVFEPYVDALPKELSGLPCIEFCADYKDLSRADIVVLLVNHAPFAEIDKTQLQNKIVIDTRGMWQ